MTRSQRRVYNDMDAFDASVEQRDHLGYGGRLVIAGAALDGVSNGATCASDTSDLSEKDWNGGADGPV